LVNFPLNAFPILASTRQKSLNVLVLATNTKTILDYRLALVANIVIQLDSMTTFVGNALANITNLTT